MKTYFFRFFLLVSAFLLHVFSISAQTGWVNQNFSVPNYSLNSVYTVTNSNAYIGGGYVSSSMPYYSYFIYCSTTNSGANWITMTTGYGYYVKSLQFINAQTGYAGAGSYEYTTLEDTYGQHILKTTNGGSSWQYKYTISITPGFNMDITDIHFLDENTGWASARDSKVLKTTNAGQNWTVYYTPQYSRKNGIFFVNSNTGYVCGDTGAVFISTNGGINWSKQSISVTQHLKSIWFSSTSTGWCVGSNGTIIKTTNSGINWTSISSVTVQDLNCVTFTSASKGWIAGNNIILGTSNGGVNWSSQFSGTANLTSVSFSDSVNGYSCGGNKIYATVTGGWTQVTKNGNYLPVKFRLYENYPNPFNPETKIKFDIPEIEFVILKVFDIRGKEVRSLANTKLEPGNYEVVFNGDGLNTGIYFYRIITDRFSETKKMVLIK